MKKRLAAAAVSAGVALGAAAPNAGNIYAWPDMDQGMWAAVMGASFGNGKVKRVAFPLTAAAAAARQARAKQPSGSASCAPVGPLGIIGAGYPLKFYFTPGEIVIMSDMDALWVRHVYMDGKQHHDYGPSYEGYSVGHWDGNTLVIQTSDLSDKVNLTTGVPASARTQLTERYTLLSPDKMMLNVTVFDPTSMTAPWHETMPYVHHADWEIEDVFCGEGNRDAPDANGNEEVNLTPPTS